MASRSGYMLRIDQARATASAKLCSCGHAVGDHLELQPTIITIEGTTVTQTPNPDYRPLHFHCRHCGCVKDHS